VALHTISQSILNGFHMLRPHWNWLHTSYT